MLKHGISYKSAMFFFSLFFFGNFALANKIIYVDDDASGANDGSNWQNAYIYLQDALADANLAEKPVEIRVAQGTYKPDKGAGHTAGDREASFKTTSGVILSGGYAGIFDPDQSRRDYEKYVTILSGDLSGNDIEVNDPNFLENEPTREDNSYCVITAYQAVSLSVLDGFKIAGGTLFVGRGVSFGGGIRMGSGKLQIYNCSFLNNFGASGAGILINNGQITVINCLFKANSSSNGGAIYNKNGEIKLVNCVFENNLAEYKGGAIHNEDGKIIIENSSFKNNTASDGGAVYSHNNLKYSSLTSSLFVGNSATNNGGAMYMESNYSPIEIKNITFIRNSALQGKAIFTSSDLKIRNSILYNGGQDEIWNNNASKIEVCYSNVQNGLAAIYDPNTKLVWCDGNIDTEPLFTDPNNGDYHLKSQAGRWDSNTQSWVIDNNTSPCIDAGDPMSPIRLEPFPNGGYINMGAYGGTTEASKSYFGKPVCETIVAGDINGDCRVDINDMLIMLSHWLEENNPGSEIINGVEFRVQTDKTFYKQGESVQMDFSVTNLNNETVYIHCSQGAYLNLKVKKDVIEIWSKVQGTTWDMPVIELSAGESDVIFHSWDMINDDGYLVGPGTYDIFGIMYNSPWNDAREPGNYYPTEVRTSITISASAEP
ncbi:MAG: hypothetical protein JW787_18030 [Sedimentisphaerales bacterium]|nr:hypothetical protein [Sedimentisphaerales bacterium]